MNKTPGSLKARLALVLGAGGFLYFLGLSLVWAIVFAPGQWNPWLLLAGLVAGMGAGSIGWLCASWIAAPIKAIAGAVQRIRSIDLLTANAAELQATIPDSAPYAEAGALAEELRALVCTLREQEVQLLDLNGSLEHRVVERTQELLESNANLQGEIQERHRVESECQHLIVQLQELAETDVLTGLYNRRHFDNMAAREWQRSQRMQRPLAILLFDIDHFKKINDTYGHAAGDIVLKGVAQRCQALLREIDLLGRYGGEEFAILLQEADTLSAVMIAERLRATIAAKPILVDDKPLTVTASIGVAITADHTPGVAQLMEQADAALYRAKHAGRNRVVVA